MARFDDLEAAINNRIQKLEARQDADWVNEMGRKVAEAVALLARIVAQHAEREQDIQLEGTVRRVSEVETKVAGWNTEYSMMMDAEQLTINFEQFNTLATEIF